MHLSIAIEESHRKPFPYFLGRLEGPLSEAFSWVEWLESSAPWALTNEEFYDQFEFSLLHTDLPDTLDPLVSPQTLRTLRRLMEDTFGARLHDAVDVTAHKLVPGQTIKVHNDHIAGGETHRLLLQLTPDWSPTIGGFLMLFGGSEPESVERLIEPTRFSVQAFEISPFSYHAVSTVHSGARYTVVYSFHPQTP